jgi:tetratricopeptide (TPR) repeat protein
LIAYALHRGRVPLDDGLRRLQDTRAQLRDDRLAEALILLDEAMMLAAVGRQDDARSAADRAERTFADLGQRRWLEMSKAIQGEIARREGNLDRAEGLLRSVHGFFRDQGDANNALQLATDLAEVLCDMGRFEEADRLASEVARDAAADDLEVQVAWRSVRARASTGVGRAPSAITFAEEAASIADSTDLVLLQAEAHRALAEALASAERPDDAVRQLEVTIDRYRSKQANVPAEETIERLRSLRPAAG